MLDFHEILNLETFPLSFSQAIQKASTPQKERIVFQQKSFSGANSLLVSGSVNLLAWILQQQSKPIFPILPSDDLALASGTSCYM